MPVYLSNLYPSEHVLSEFNPPITLGVGQVVNVTSELRGLTNDQYNSLQQHVLHGHLLFVRSGVDADFPTGGLFVSSAQSIINVDMKPKGGKLTPQSPVYFDSEGQPLKGILIEWQAAGEIEFYGSIDQSVVTMEARKWLYQGKIGQSDPGMMDPGPAVVEKLAKFRFIQVRPLRGSQPPIHFLSSYS